MNAPSTTKTTRRTLPYTFHQSAEDRPDKRPKTMELSTSSQKRHLQRRLTSSHRIADIISVIEVMKHQESTVYRPSQYLDQTTLTPEDRVDVCEWGFNLVDACDVDRNIAVIGIQYFDRFLSCRGLRVVELCLSSEREFQLAFIACLVIALKGREGLKATPDFVAQTLCKDMYHAEEVIEMELQVLRTLGWHLNGPTAKDYIGRFMEVLPSKISGASVEGADADEAAKLFFEAAVRKSELAMLDYSLALEPPSGLALASVASLMCEIDQQTCYLLDGSTWLNHIGFIMEVASANRPDVPDIESSRSDQDMSMTCHYVSGDDSRGDEPNPDTL